MTAASFVARSTTERRAPQGALEHDDLTGLPNRALLDDRLDQAVAGCGRHEDPLTVLLVDLDGSKDVNDGHGHLLGDVVLQTVAERLEDLRPEDTVARFGGDELVALLPQIGVDEGREVAERLLAAVRRPMTVRGRRVHVSASIGVAGELSLQAEARLALAAELPRRSTRTVCVSSTSRWWTCAAAPCSASRRSWAGTTRSAARSRRPTSCRRPRRPGSARPSTGGCCTAPAPSSARCPAPDGCPTTSTSPST